MILRVKPTTTRIKDQQSSYPNGQHTLAFYIKCVPPVGLFAVFAGVCGALRSVPEPAGLLYKSDFLIVLPSSRRGPNPDKHRDRMPKGWSETHELHLRLRPAPSGV